MNCPRCGTPPQPLTLHLPGSPSHHILRSPAQPRPAAQPAPEPPCPGPRCTPAAGPAPTKWRYRPAALPPEIPEWQGASQGEPWVLWARHPGRVRAGRPEKQPRPARQWLPGLFACGLKDPGAQPLFFGQPSPRPQPGDPLACPCPRVVGASPVSPPALSSHPHCQQHLLVLSPLSSSPANPNSDEVRCPGMLPSAFFHPAPHPQEAGSPALPSPSLHSLPIHWPEPAKTFPFPTEGLEETPFPAGAPGGQCRPWGSPQEPPSATRPPLPPQQRQPGPAGRSTAHLQAV